MEKGLTWSALASSVVVSVVGDVDLGITLAESDAITLHFLFSARLAPCGPLWILSTGAARLMREFKHCMSEPFER